MKLNYKCAICGKEFNRIKPHIIKHNMDYKTYYDTYISNTFIHSCQICGNPVEFSESKFRYNETCSSECFNKWRFQQNTKALQRKYGVENVFQLDDVKTKAKQSIMMKYGVENVKQSELIKQKIIKTNLENYGCEWGFQNEIVKEKIRQTTMMNCGYDCNLKDPALREKAKQTKIERYGNENYVNIEKAKQTKLKRYGNENYVNVEKTKQTKLDKYGDENYVNAEKAKQTIQEKYGVDYFTQSPEYKEKRKKTSIAQTKEKYNTSDYEVISYDFETVKMLHRKCETEFEIKRQLLNLRLKRNEEVCTCCNKINYCASHVEKNLYEYVKSLNKNVINNDRSVLKGYELDVFIPEKKLAIEFDGLYWHNELNKENNYHLWKTNSCENNGIQLIHIFEDEWLNKQDIVKSRIKGLLGLNSKIYARKTIVKEIPFEESKLFLDMNHIQGNCISEFRYGLYFNDELVSVMTFGKSRFNSSEYELLRFCNKLNTNVIGGASKLFKHFLKDHPEINEVISYADRRWSIGNVYRKLNFKYVGNTPINYFYVIDANRINRMQFQKHKLIKQGYSKDMSEHEIMLERKIYRIYDCGNLKFKWTKE